MGGAMTYQDIPAADGRVLDVLVAGAASGPALVAHHGTPSDASTWLDWSDAVAAHGLRLLSISRPGYASSTRQPGRDVASVAADVRAVLDHFAIPWFVTMGASGGGPHALASAALLGDRCRGAATLAGVGPFDRDDLDFLAGMGPENVEEFGAAIVGEAPVRAWIETHGAGMRTVTRDDIIAALGGLIPVVDQEALTNGLAEGLASSSRRALAASFDGWIDDDLAFAKPWGFALDAMSVPVTIWQGDLDLMVPFAHGAWLAAHVPGARSRMVSGHGHLSLLNLRETILTELLAGVN
jgi:pimeloyl-ACP methyl ester carboxylesterase